MPRLGFRRATTGFAVAATVVARGGCGTPPQLDRQEQVAFARECTSLIERNLSGNTPPLAALLSNETLNLDEPASFYSMLERLRGPSTFDLHDPNRGRRHRTTAARQLQHQSAGALVAVRVEVGVDVRVHIGLDVVHDEPDVDDGARLVIERAPRSWLDVAVPVVLVAGTAATRVPGLSDPRAFVFDEIYYAPDAAEMLRRGVERGGVVHPPGGKWLIASGIRIFGFTPFGWRFAALVCGCLIVLLTYYAARQIVAGRLLPALAAVAVALDGVAFTTGRSAHLDVFLAPFTTAAITLTLVALRDPENERRVRWCQVGAGVVLGFGLTVKWSAAFLLLAVMLAFLWLHARRPPSPGHGRRVLTTVLTFTVLPLGVYLAVYTPWIVNADKTYIHITDCKNEKDCSLSVVNRFRQFFEDQNRIRIFQQESLQDNNSNADLSWKWVNQTHPSTLFRKTCIPELNEAPNDLSDAICAGAAPGDIAEIVTVANPVVWFTAMAAGLVLVWRIAFRRDRIAFFLLAFGLYQWLPWAINPRHSYTFYIAPLIPAIALWTVAVLAQKPFRWIAPVFAVLTVAAFAFYYPIWAGKPMTPDQIHAREYWRAY